MPRLPGVKISEVPNSAVGQPRNSYIPPETPNLSWTGARSAPELDWKKKGSKKVFLYDRPAGLSVSTPPLFSTIAPRNPKIPKVSNIPDQSRMLPLEFEHSQEQEPLTPSSGREARARSAREKIKFSYALFQNRKKPLFRPTSGLDTFLSFTPQHFFFERKLGQSL